MKLEINELEIRLRARDIQAEEIVEACKFLGAKFRAHPLGFISCLFLTEGRRNARVHIWPVLEYEPQSHDTQIHNHVFNFESWVLCGAVRNVEKIISTHGDPYALYCASYIGDKSIITKTENTVALSTLREVSYYAGDSYAVSADQLHQTIRIGEGGAVTVLITEQVSQESPLVMGAVNGPQSYEYVRAVVPDLELDKIIKEIL